MNSLRSFLLTLLLFPALPVHAAWTPVDPKHDNEVWYVPSVCLMYNFGGKATDPLYPGSYNNLVELNNDIYGASDNGNCAKCYGMIFKMTPKGAFEITHKFDGIEGNAPTAGLVKGPGNSLLGATYVGGKVEYQSIAGNYTKNTAVGTIYSTGGSGISPIWSFRNNGLRKINCIANIGCDPPWTEKEKFDAPPSYPWSPPVTNLAGKTMGVTPYAYNNRIGALYSLDGGYSTVEIMDGTKAKKLLSLTPGVADNNFYGTSAFGKDGNLHGTVFTTGGGPIQIIHEFNGDDGSAPTHVIQDKKGRLYGTTYWGGMYRRQLGVIYTMNADGSDYKILHHFNGKEGSNPISALVFGKDGRLYGSTRYGGTWGDGVLFRVDPDGSQYAVLHHFKQDTTGKGPMGNMILHSGGDFYGTVSLDTRKGGSGGGIFRMDVGHSVRESIDPPGQRYCCSLGQNDEFSSFPTAPSLEPTALGGHKYGSQKTGDPFGYVYTTKAGLIDIGHVRDMIDMVKYQYEWMMRANRNKLEIGGMTNGLVRPIQLPLDQEEVLKIASAMTYVDGVAHELITWDQYWIRNNPDDKLPLPTGGPQDFSSFSPEDLVSNVVGIEIAERVIRMRCEMDFDKAVDLEMQKMMEELGAQPAAYTDKVREAVRGDHLGSNVGKWFYEDAQVWEVILRRNFYVNPWLVPFQHLGAYRPRWLNSARFEPYYKYFDYGVKGTVDGEKDVYIGNMFEKMEKLRIKWETQNKGMTKWP